MDHKIVKIKLLTLEEVRHIQIRERWYGPALCELYSFGRTRNNFGSCSSGVSSLIVFLPLIRNSAEDPSRMAKIRV
jgi:hypothetical protein